MNPASSLMQLPEGLVRHEGVLDVQTRRVLRRSRHRVRGVQLEQVRPVRLEEELDGLEERSADHEAEPAQEQVLRRQVGVGRARHLELRLREDAELDAGARVLDAQRGSGAARTGRTGPRPSPAPLPAAARRRRLGSARPAPRLRPASPAWPAWPAWRPRRIRQSTPGSARRRADPGATARRRRVRLTESQLFTAPKPEPHRVACRRCFARRRRRNRQRRCLPARTRSIAPDVRRPLRTHIRASRAGLAGGAGRSAPRVSADAGRVDVPARARGASRAARPVSPAAPLEPSPPVPGDDPRAGRAGRSVGSGGAAGPSPPAPVRAARAGRRCRRCRSFRRARRCRVVPPLPRRAAASRGAGRSARAAGAAASAGAGATTRAAGARGTAARRLRIGRRERRLVEIEERDACTGRSCSRPGRAARWADRTRRGP